MPRTCPGTADAVELAELLQFTARGLTADPATLASSFLACIGHPAYGLDQLRADPDRFTFLLGATTGSSPPAKTRPDSP